MSGLIPKPASFEARAGEFVLDADTEITASDAAASVARRLQADLAAATGFALPVGGGVPTRAGIALEIDPDSPAEGFRLEVAPGGVRIAGGSAAGLFYGAMAFRQQLGPDAFRRAALPGRRWRAEASVTVDAPRFAWRGFLLDVARSFRPKHEVLRLIDLLALHRVNVLQLHLTDDQGWRMQIHRYPRLTEVGAWRPESQLGHGPKSTLDGRPAGGFYTHDELREIVAYAAERHIEVVPEIETPGHVRAALAAYPELGVTGGPRDVWTRYGINDDVLNTEESTVEFFRNVLDEVMEVFPSRYIGVGGDEARKTQWAADPRSQQLMAERGLETPNELQAWFVRQLDAHLTAAGRRLYGWDEVLEGPLDPGATIASWRGIRGAQVAAARGHDVVLCPDDFAYLDYPQSDAAAEPIPVGTVQTIRDVYDYEPLPADAAEALRRHLLGVQANAWSEHMDTASRVDYMVFPRLAAFAEVAWSAPGKDWPDFSSRLDGQLAIYDAIGVAYRPLSGPNPWQQRPGVPGVPRDKADRQAELAALTADLLE
ncbi:beta-N-acetylhexosaminidase [Agromyces badenianii]|uniref:beta-N-acetylhexosaminidase n=1 Tax=Agromyces badenianii TaxID=2080742 RepID=A0A2S0WT21_9MICO|nr:beta-N-acetylhexosaminidase [Agromyces badenianii]AWB94493.1 beta-N-acetylhexosaminidase [Agromyces badenianii]